MFSGNLRNRTILQISKAALLGITIESLLLTARRRPFPHILKFYQQFLKPFLAYCDANARQLVHDVAADFLRQYFMAFAESHNPGGVHASFRTPRAFFRWLPDEEMMPAGWKNPMLKVKAPKVAFEPSEPVAIPAVKSTIGTCSSGSRIDERDRAIFLVLLERGLPAKELCEINRADVGLSTGRYRPVWQGRQFTNCVPWQDES